MSIRMEQDDDQEEQRRRPGIRRAVNVGWGLYQQVADVFAAFGLAALIGTYWHIGWRGWLTTLVGIWSHTVRPAMAFVFHALVTVPLGWIHIRFVVPLPVRDYVSIGLVLALSLIREESVHGSPSRREEGWRAGLREDLRDYSELVLECATLWPVALVFLVEDFIPFHVLRKENRRKRRLAGARVLDATEIRDTLSVGRMVSPLFYLGILLGLNFFILR